MTLLYTHFSPDSFKRREKESSVKSGERKSGLKSTIELGRMRNRNENNIYPIM